MSDLSKDEEFFVGYVAVPFGQKRFLRVLLITLLAFIVIAGFTIAAAQRDPGPGVWNLQGAKSFEGIIYSTPFSLIRIIGVDGSPMSIILVDQGKHGVSQRIAPFVGHAVRVTGHMITRTKLLMLELDESDAAIQEITTSSALTNSRLALPAQQRKTPLKLPGEIIDPKCFAGAMKPGNGKTHKACASLCIRGGIPPMFVSRQGSTASESVLEYVIIGDNGNIPADEELEKILPFVSDDVEIEGFSYELGDLHLLQINPRSIRRL